MDPTTLGAAVPPETPPASERQATSLRSVVSAIEEERRRISLELHDALGQDVSALALKLAALEQMELPEPLRRELEAMERVVHRLDENLERIAWDLRPAVLDEMGLEGAIREHVAGWSRYHDTPVRLNFIVKRRLPAALELAIYRIAQEALMNVAKHARAREACLEVLDLGSSVRLEVQDDGVGFASPGDRDDTGLGLPGVRERAALVGGVAEVESRPGAGTRITVTVPT